MAKRCRYGAAVLCACALACGGELVSSEDGPEASESSGAGDELGSESGGSESGGSDSTGSDSTGSDSTGASSECVELEFTPVDHPAFEGTTSGTGLPWESRLMVTQAEVDAQAQSYCELLCPHCGPAECNKGPKLGPGEALVYLHIENPSGPVALDTLSVEDCGAHVLVTAELTTGCELSFQTGWDAVIIDAPPLADSVMLVTEPGPDQCGQGG